MHKTLGKVGWVAGAGQPGAGCLAAPSRTRTHVAGPADEWPEAVSLQSRGKRTGPGPAAAPAEASGGGRPLPPVRPPGLASAHPLSCLPASHRLSPSPPGRGRQLAWELAFVLRLLCKVIGDLHVAKPQFSSFDTAGPSFIFEAFFLSTWALDTTLLVLASITDLSLSASSAGASSRPHSLCWGTPGPRPPAPPPWVTASSLTACQSNLHSDDGHVPICSHSLSTDLQTLTAKCWLQVSRM